MPKLISLEGNQAVAQAMRQLQPDLVAAYPITPQTEIVQEFSQFVADGEVDTEFIAVESEHSAMSACIGAACAGGRVMTATSSQGLALMWELLYIASALRLPIVMPVVNRALSANINIHCDHSDTMGARDSGWIQIYSENAQESYDNTIQAVRIAEDERLRLPVMVTLDGFIISHAVEVLQLIEDQIVRDFLGEYQPTYTLFDFAHPVTFGPFDLYDFYFEHKRQQAEAYKAVSQVVLEVGQEFGKISGRDYGIFEAYRLEDAELAIVLLGSTAGTAKEVVDELRGEGLKVGLLKLRLFRPFPVDEVREALKNLQVIAVLDRSDTLSGIGGPVFTDIRSVLYGQSQVKIVNYIYGLGGRDVNMTHIHKVYQDLTKIQKTGQIKQLINYLGVRE